MKKSNLLTIMLAILSFQMGMFMSFTLGFLSLEFFVGGLLYFISLYLCGLIGINLVIEKVNNK